VAARESQRQLRRPVIGKKSQTPDHPSQPNIHSHPNHPEISLDTTSYKLYYVNYKIGLLFAPVRNLFKNPARLKPAAYIYFPFGLLSC
jgi:hypothetical protein